MSAASLRETTDQKKGLGASPVVEWVTEVMAIVVPEMLWTIVLADSKKMSFVTRELYWALDFAQTVISTTWASAAWPTVVGSQAFAGLTLLLLDPLLASFFPGSTLLNCWTQFENFQAPRGLLVEHLPCRRSLQICMTAIQELC